MKKKIVILAVAALLAALYLWRYNVVNARYPDTVTKTYQMGEAVPYKEFEVVVTNAEVLDSDKFAELYTAALQSSPAAEAKLIVVDLEVTNTGDTEQKYAARQTALTSFAWRNGYSTFYRELLGDLPTEAILQPGETKPLRLVFENYVGTYATRADWEAAELSDFYLRLTEYPVLQQVQLH